MATPDPNDVQFSFPRYLLSKQSVDDRALNRHVLEALKRHLPPQPIRIIEMGAGIGTMLRRLVGWNLLHHGEYVLVDQMLENIEFAETWLRRWAEEPQAPELHHVYLVCCDLQGGETPVRVRVGRIETTPTSYIPMLQDISAEQARQQQSRQAHRLAFPV